MSDRSGVQLGKRLHALTKKGFHNELINKTKAFNKETKKLQRAIDKLYETFNNTENVGITEALMSVKLNKDIFENVVLSLRELSALDRWGESTEVRDTVNSTAAKFLQATDEAIHEATRRLHLADEIIHAAGCKTTTSSVEASIRSGSHSSLKSEHRKALANAAAAKE
jgi:ABC-type enterochelin transport system substrate-binding protein